MSWAEEDWTVGLSGRVLQKVKELQVHQERLSRENKQKQLQLDNIHISLGKHTAKYEGVRSELQSVQRELTCVQEEAKTAFTIKERLSQDVHIKQAQLCSLEGQLEAARGHNTKLSHEIKRLEAELEKLQNSTKMADNTLFSTPCWNPSSYRGIRQEESPVQREGNNRQSRQRLHFSDVATPSSTPCAAFPWEQRESTPTAPRRRQLSSQTQPRDVTNQDVRVQGDYGGDDRREAEEMRSRVSSLEAELSEKTRMFQCVQTEHVQSKKEVAAKQLSLQNAHSELSVSQTRLVQEKERTSAAEQKLKQVQEELKCQRQNAESIRLQQQQRIKEQEKQHQRDLSELQKERQFVEKQHQQEVNKLNQELQQERSLHNVLQAQFDKLSLQKQILDKEFDGLKAKLKWTEDELKERQKKETQLQGKLTEAVREVESVTVSLEQSRKRERSLEEESRRLAEERLDALRQLKELQEQKSTLAVSFQPVQGFSSTSSFPHPPRPPAKRSVFHQTRADDEEPAQQPNLYCDREPGEGIDSEHMSVTSSSENKSRNKEISSTIPGNDSDHPHSAEKSPFPSEQSVFSQDLKKENDTLRSELQDVREELQKRLQDLEAQRQAEAEARTRLKQLSRKHANQSTVKEEKGKDLKAQLESERAETERLKKLVLEVEFKRKQESNMAEEERETELMELNIQLKNQLAEVKAQLALEQEESNQKFISNTDVEDQLSSKVAELTAEVEELRCRIKESEEEESLSADNVPLKYQSLHNDELNANMDVPENKVNANMEAPKHKVDANMEAPEHKVNANMEAPEHKVNANMEAPENKVNANMEAPENKVNANMEAPENKVNANMEAPEHKVNMLESEEFSMIDLDASSLSDEDETDPLTFSLSEISSSDMSETQHLKKECERQTQRAAQCQLRLEALQKQVTRQTQQLTTAFEKQSLHIAGLLAELQDKDKSHEEELLLCRNELEAVKSANLWNHVHHDQNDGLNPDITVNHPESDKQDVEEPRPVPRSGEPSELVRVQQENLVFNENEPQSGIQTQNPEGSVELCEQQHENQTPLSTHTIHTLQITHEDDHVLLTSQDDVNDLQQQVGALQMQIKSLSEELTLWKLSSQPAPTFNMPDLQTDPDEMIQAQTHTLCRQDNVVVVREDQLLLSCSSRKLQGHLFCSRLEPKTFRPSETATLQELIQDTANNNQESKSEKQKVEALHQLKGKTDVELVQISKLRKGTQPGAVKDSQEAGTRTLASEEPANRNVRSVSSQTHPLNVCTATQTDEEGVESPPLSPVSAPESLRFMGAFPIPADPARLAERIRRNRTQMSAAFDDTEYEPYGLPEVVMKGFADIPSGPSCPYIVRRGLLGTTVLPTPEKQDETD